MRLILCPACRETFKSKTAVAGRDTLDKCQACGRRALCLAWDVHTEGDNG